MKELELESPDQVLKFIDFLANKKKPTGNAVCLCGSGQSYRLCHKKTVIGLQHLNNKILKLLYSFLLKEPYKGMNL